MTHAAVDTRGHVISRTHGKVLVRRLLDNALRHPCMPTRTSASICEVHSFVSCFRRAISQPPPDSDFQSRPSDGGLATREAAASLAAETTEEEWIGTDTCGTEPRTVLSG